MFLLNIFSNPQGPGFTNTILLMIYFLPFKLLVKEVGVYVSGEWSLGTTHPKSHWDGYPLFIYGRHSPDLTGFVVYFFAQAQGVQRGWTAQTSVGKEESVASFQILVPFCVMFMGFCSGLKVPASFPIWI